MSDIPQTNHLFNYLLQDGLLSEIEIANAVKNSNEIGESLCTHLVRTKILSSDEILKCWLNHLDLPVHSLIDYKPPLFDKEILSHTLIRRYRIIPLGFKQNTIDIGVSDPTDTNSLSAIRLNTGWHVKIFLVSESKLNDIIEKYYTNDTLRTHLEQALKNITPYDESPNETLNHLEEPIIDLVDQLFAEALENEISDVHLEPYENFMRIRFRKNGLLEEVTTLPNQIASRVIMRLKVMANLNIAEKRLPQDGHFQILKTNDCRISTCPTLFGEKILIRLLTKQHSPHISQLGFSPYQQDLFLKILSQPQGLILVTGPTGSGKTTSLYAGLHYLNQITKNIFTIEDPVEIQVPGINQINVNPSIGLDFATILRTLLRQDPDVIMIGEIRDRETATIAMQAAQTGHLVLSTMHTLSALESIYRLKMIGIPIHDLIHSLSMIIAQRLLRKLCEYCRYPIQTENIHSYQADGCEFCQYGYQGRFAIFEMLAIENKIISGIEKNLNLSELLLIAQAEKFIPLWKSGCELVKKGLTSLNELKRMVSPYAKFF